MVSWRRQVKFTSTENVGVEGDLHACVCSGLSVTDGGSSYKTGSRIFISQATAAAGHQGTHVDPTVQELGPVGSCWGHLSKEDVLSASSAEWRPQPGAPSDLAVT